MQKRGAHPPNCGGAKRAVSHHSFLGSRRWVGWRGSIESFCALADGQEVWQSGQLSSPSSLGAVGGGDGVGFHGARKSYCVRPSAPPRIDHRSCQREVSGSEQRIDSLPAQVKRQRNFGHAARRTDAQNTPRALKWDPSSLRGHACAHAPLPARGEHMSGVMTPIFPRSKGSNTWIEGEAHFGIHRRASSLLSVARVMREEGRHAGRVFRFPRDKVYSAGHCSLRRQKASPPSR